MRHYILPFPPSINHYYKNGRGGQKYIGPAGKLFRAKTIALVRNNHHFTILKGRLRVTVEFYAPDRRRRDIGNIDKALMDALTHAGVWIDDEQIDDVRYRRMPPDKPGRVEVFVSEIEYEPHQEKP